MLGGKQLPKNICESNTISPRAQILNFRRLLILNLVKMLGRKLGKVSALNLRRLLVHDLGRPDCLLPFRNAGTHGDQWLRRLFSNIGFIYVYTYIGYEGEWKRKWKLLLRVWGFAGVGSLFSMLLLILLLLLLPLLQYCYPPQANMEPH